MTAETAETAEKATGHLSGDGAAIPLAGGTTAHVQFSFRNLARLEERYGDHATWHELMSTQPFLTLLDLLVTFRLAPDRDAAGTLLDGQTGTAIDAAWIAIREAYMAAVPFVTLLPAPGAAVGEAPDPPPA